MKSKKGFATAIFAALVVIALAFAASVLLVRDSGFQNAQLQARLAFERFEDARDFANATQEDAIVDSAYAVFGCSPSAADFCSDYSSRSASYWAAASGVLNDSVAKTLFSPQGSCALISSDPSQSLSTFAVNFSGVLNASASSGVASKEGFEQFSKTVAITAPSQKNGNTFSVLVMPSGTFFSYACPSR